MPECDACCALVQENKRLSEPLTVALTDVAELHAHLKGQDKDRLSLASTKARLRVIDEQVGAAKGRSGNKNIVV